MAWLYSTPFNFSAHPFTGRSTQTINPLPMDTPIPYGTYFSPGLQNTKPASISSRAGKPCRPLPKYLHTPVAFQHYGPTIQMERLDIKIGWFRLVILTSRFEATQELFWEGPRHFEPRSDDEENT
ncbi:hypothetical protein AVEN_188906-1 [Araneus ventricosus]|uniref:Uncharacterized protein n=1 Tax=Araneus ventricosus TaxID=182803 RepID=A0A4Y2W4A1_ARAVE|nr:hypothetical protein AVEN_238164-1 [Araneus ventricosus]GBO30955.1 hypothetical protein AVEN_130911-1 [Araneus ventricosus]GBO30960.1 hypothetical protein AVEN_154098-1 [Araneus ventricosus]GBO30963.1 hypothetical protein AVEN_188906-1 [Araneus ventricosus]